MIKIIIPWVIITNVLIMVGWSLVNLYSAPPNTRWYDEFNNEITTQVVYYETVKCDHGVYYHIGNNGVLTPAYKINGQLIGCYSKTE